MDRCLLNITSLRVRYKIVSRGQAFGEEHKESSNPKIRWSSNKKDLSVTILNRYIARTVSLYCYNLPGLVLEFLELAHEIYYRSSQVNL